MVGEFRRCWRWGRWGRKGREIGEGREEPGRVLTSTHRNVTVLDRVFYIISKTPRFAVNCTGTRSGVTAVILLYLISRETEERGVRLSMLGYLICNSATPLPPLAVIVTDKLCYPPTPTSSNCH